MVELRTTSVCGMTKLGQLTDRSFLKPGRVAGGQFSAGRLVSGRDGQQVPLILRRGDVRARRRGRLLQDHVRVGSTETEGAYSCAARSRHLWPRQTTGWHADGGAVPIDVRRGRAIVRVRRQLPP